MKFTILNLPDTKKYLIQRSWAGSFGTATLKEKHHGGRFLPVYILYAASALLNVKKNLSIIDAQAKGLNNEETISEIKKEKADVIISMLCLPSYKNDLEILNKIKEGLPNTKIVLVGGLVNVIPEKILNESKVDFLINGRYPFYNNLIEFIKNQEEARGIIYKKNGKIIKNPKLEESNDLNNINFEAYHLIDLEKYKMMAVDIEGNIIKEVPVLTGVGCPYPCSYCAYPLAYGKRIFHKEVDLIIDEIQYLASNFNVSGFDMRDVVFTQNRKKVIEICDKILERNLKIKFVFETRANLVDKELLQILKRAGCYKINFGVESGNEKILRNVGKPGLDIEKLKNAFKLTREEGIISLAHIILGLPGENKETIKETYKLLKELNADIANFNFITPYPGTQLYDLAKSKNLIVDDNWPDYSSHNVVMRSEELSAEDLKRIGKRINRKYTIYKLLTDKRFRKLWLKKRL